MHRKGKVKLHFWACTISILTLVCLVACTQQGYSTESQLETAIASMDNKEIFIKYVCDGEASYYRLTATDEFINRLDLRSWKQENKTDDLSPDEYLVIRIAEGYEIVIYPNQIGKIYDHYGALASHSAAEAFYKANMSMQTIVDFIEQNAESTSYNIGFEN